MPVSVTMPRLGESVTEGTITRWLKQEGDRVEADEPLLEVSTDKVDTEIPAPAAGVLARIVVREDETAEVGSELAIIAGDGESVGDSAPAGTGQAETRPEPVQPTTTAAEESEPEAPAPDASRAAASQPQASGGQSPNGAAGGPTTSVTMPALGESVTEGTVTRWLKSVGDTVEADEPLLEVSTDKVDTEIPAPASGTLLEIKVPEDETVAVGAELAVIGAAGGAQAAPAQQTAPAQQPAQQPAPAAAAAPAAAPAQASGNGTGPQAGTAQAVDDFAGYVTPLVRRLASEHGVDLSSLTGTGVGGRIRKQDVLDAAERQRAAAKPAPAAAPARTAAPSAPYVKPQPSPLRGRTEKLTRIRKITAQRMVESLQISAQLTTVVEVDVTRIAKLRQQAKAQFEQTHGVKLSFLPFFALAAVEALRVHPNVNASIDLEAGTVTYHDGEHLGIAVDTEKGLMVPVIHDAGDLNLAGLAKRIADLAERARTNKLTPDDLSAGTFTLTNTGSRGALFDTPIINQPQVGILGTGSVVKRAVVVTDPELGEVIVPRSMVYLALSYDHRQVDGADAARFLTTIKERLEGGNFESELGLA
ncbi:2-oxoglutarate dehydrogenase, E2 component, dihydrolipoamide succinyltransferase [Planosporangium flavigriseum]|uniref:Dihydrolipoamide acetyltransferase component of pyruvate dehydrogenase complex n=1 Tax=Planosporangium flavigriseum TaxID=373681 RepID=A0A8J3PJS7_9ACTN|nr:2-oxoglutarate dehydrogenase, E2 component, dihydrolipoamide succinyltransferase [Planosporangium flavigriseum]NJC63325.1 2-oxoglutarate dehydrogenase, E2 component, dihydrolipoamide succinyltransferase [Planosporangium flavigriseum]GIG72601.1 dihydrolipoamide acetyltransferase component of pyruvate dehydrogenase complex [Planosporangium flavigriseum]